MAQISVTISTQFSSSFGCSLFGERLLSIDIATEIASGYSDCDGREAHHLYERSVVNFHGTLADLQLLADRIVAAVYPEECKLDVDAQIDAAAEEARGELHGGL